MTAAASTYRGFFEWLVFWLVYWGLGPKLPGDQRAFNIVPASRVVKTVARNCLLSLPASFLLMTYCPILTDFSFCPIVPAFLLRFLASAVVMDGWFYYAHRLLHHRWFYRWHKQHHSFRYTYPLVAVYSSVPEALLCDFLSNALGPALFGMSVLETSIWSALMAFNALKLHSTLDFGWMRGREHGFHHNQQLGNYGLFSLFDKLHGTYQE